MLDSRRFNRWRFDRTRGRNVQRAKQLGTTIMLFRARFAKRLLQPREEPVVAAHALNFHFAKTMYDVTILPIPTRCRAPPRQPRLFRPLPGSLYATCAAWRRIQFFALQMDDEKVGEEPGGMPAGALISISRRAPSNGSFNCQTPLRFSVRWRSVIRCGKGVDSWTYRNRSTSGHVGEVFPRSGPASEIFDPR